MSTLIDAFAVESAEFEIGGGGSWPKSVFLPALAKMAPKDYWCLGVMLRSWLTRGATHVPGSQSSCIGYAHPY